MKTVSINFKISHGHFLYIVSYSEYFNEWHIYRGEEFLDKIHETRPHNFKNDNRAQQILRLVLNNN